MSIASDARPPNGVSDPDRSKPSSSRPNWRGLLTIGVGASLVAYPILVYFALTRFDARGAGLLLGIVFVPLAVVRARRLSAAQRRSFAMVPVLVGLCVAGTIVANKSGFLLAAPVVINAVLLVGFSATLRAGSMPMIERFARLTTSDLSAREAEWCRSWTWVWCSFFVVNGCAATSLALLADHRWWALYNGLIVYVCMGVLFVSEYVWRKLRFGRIGTRWPERWLQHFATSSGKDA